MTRSAEESEHDRDPIVLAQLESHMRQAFDDQWQFVGFVHRSGNVNQKDEIGKRSCFAGDFAALDADADPPVILIPRATGDFSVRSERMS